MKNWKNTEDMLATFKAFQLGRSHGEEGEASAVTTGYFRLRAMEAEAYGRGFAEGNDYRLWNLEDQSAGAI